jgi:RNA polymerase sigma factor (sigma-70 family)
MHPAPETRHSLILRLPQAADRDAWMQFVAAYEPLVYSFARRQGLQDADARELVQNVFIAVARAVHRWKPDPDRAKFRTWLARIAKHQLINLVARRPVDMATGRDSHLWLLDQQPASDPTYSSLEIEFQRERFRVAADRVQQKVQTNTWKAFWQTAVQQQPIANVAASLGMSEGAVYIARCRVLALLQREVARYREDDHAM